MGVGTPVKPHAWDRFVEAVNSNRFDVLEIGSRLLGEGIIQRRQFFPAAPRYVGMDVHAGPNVDMVGDVQRLSAVLRGDRFGAIHSHSVLEHVPLPWVAAVEMIKCLRPGGVMFHHVPFCWPMHELPADYWRVTSETFKVLFPPAFGIRHEGMVFDDPLHMLLDRKRSEDDTFSENQCWGFIGAFMRKVAEPDLSAYSWPLAFDVQYPKPG